MADGLTENSLIADFDAWARLSARLLRRSPLECARIIRDAEAEHEWHRADAHWYETLLGDVEAGRTDRIDRYRLLCVEAMGARRRDGEVVPGPLDPLRPPEDGGGGAPPAFARDFGSRQPIAPAPGQRGTAMNMGGGLDAAEASERARRWTVEDYAWLRAELEHFPGREEQVWGARGITDRAARRAVQSLWDERLDAESDLSSRYHELLRGYRDVLRRRG